MKIKGSYGPRIQHAQNIIDTAYPKHNLLPLIPHVYTTVMLMKRRWSSSSPTQNVELRGRPSGYGQDCRHVAGAVLTSRLARREEE